MVDFDDDTVWLMKEAFRCGYVEGWADRTSWTDDIGPRIERLFDLWLGEM